jgi:hypothetical protein
MNPMRRSLAIILALLLSSTAVVILTSTVVKHVCARHLMACDDDLAWLRSEFRLSDAELARIRQLHDGYLPKCREMCAHIAARKIELQAALAANQGLTPEVEQKLTEIASLRAQCQVNMLRHFHEVSQAMPPEQGRRYLAEMQRITLGFHEQFENAMSAAPSVTHGHH